MNSKNIISNLRSVNQIVAVGSVDGVLTAAALMRVIGREVGLVFCQAFTVDKVDISGWTPGQRVAFVDLAVNNRDEAMTKTFVEKIKAAGHQLVAVCDEHNREDWLRVLGTFDGFVIEPISGKNTDRNSSGALLMSVLGNEADEQTRELCLAADAGDRMDFSTHFGSMANQAVKSKIADDSRRVYLARHLAQSREADQTIHNWIKEYEAIVASHAEIEKARVDLGDGLVRISTVGKTVDMTTLLNGLYKSSKVVIMEGEMYDKAAGKKTRQIALGTSVKTLDLVALLRGAGIVEASGFAQKANVSPASEEAAIAAIRAALRK